MNRKVAKAISLAIVLCSETSTTASAEDMKIVRQIILSPTHKVAPYSIARASNGDLIIAGASNIGNFRAWAMRVSQSGHPIWEFLDHGPGDGWTDYSTKDQRFYSAVALQNGNTLLCGIKPVEGKLVLFFVRIGADAKLLDERILQPPHGAFPIGVTCTAWNDGVAVLSGLAMAPHGTGWLSKFDATGDFLWQKFGDQFSSLDAMPAQAGGLYMIGGDEILKVDDQGNLLARHSLPGSEQQLLHSTAATKEVRVASMLSTLDTVILDFDLDLKGPLHTTHLDNVGLMRCFVSDAGVATLFGSRYFNQATANVTRAYKHWGSKDFTLQPRFQSPWFFDAVSTDTSTNEFATVRIFDNTGEAELAWVSFK